MTIPDIGHLTPEQLRALAYEDLQALLGQVYTEVQRRATLAAAPAEAEALAARYAEAIGREDGDQWVAPTGAHNAYPQGAIVTHQDKTWESLIPNNAWTPGESGWRENVTDGYPAWVQPAGAHDAYAKDAKVTHKGRIWTSTAASNTWAPGAYGWTDIGPA